MRVMIKKSCEYLKLRGKVFEVLKEGRKTMAIDVTPLHDDSIGWDYSLDGKIQGWHIKREDCIFLDVTTEEVLEQIIEELKG